MGAAYVNEAEAELIAAQLKHTIDLLRADLKTVNTQLEHKSQMTNHRLDQLETSHQDHEKRLRAVSDSATQFKLLASLATGGGLLSVIALLKLLLDSSN